MRRSKGGEDGFRVSRVRQMTDVEAAWIGALIEGEGSIWWVKTKRHTWPAVNVSNTDPEIISALLRTTGVGSVHHQKTPTNALIQGAKPCYIWMAQAQREAADIIRQCAPYSMKL